ncbi:aminoacyl-tRNA hydrolase [Arcanobacterium haemolyticum]|uniref:Peptidyl-tRNA hydrolase n=1 Tax=Arcanobacterium haemolyticum (strain ATCC 9345 / DSM 20595 / CCM 5947 / CCUG 17215 / LMG 16163 / NBRC 15585 / NCTC 8452 / 11018) TaxID=644284 RepID=D7BKN7_ARCHD|nr:aminoacyl-tRNA hydrolase [Arcanobacterium haemolyticum]ADH93217.1 peptidyl-tRNA hydrolase [Arcanobacterium haemolyticum DSM 20595]QCX47263.1 aminoacyl-tRNA hydrolase [Arcanobacterium haemolyticum]SPT75868.1 Peptidyl-tRNA hydrolase [Arcanobacterium haemolyticum]SQH28021.1 Peptidyl-tRNA hydrolase [Arcanobacterium haemolyticum]
MYTVVGLGNPGPTYAATRHNIGQMVIDTLARKLGISLSMHKQSQTRSGSTRVGVAPGQPGEQVVLGISTGYMNTSGGPTKALMSYYHGDVEHLIVIHDELDLPFGTLRLKRGGGEGGHNGLKSISQSTGSKNYIRLRCGIGRPPGRQDPADFVLSAFSAQERKELELMIECAADAVCDVIELGLEKATMRLHTAN